MRLFTFTLLLVLSSVLPALGRGLNKTPAFRENVGQVRDQYGHTRADIKYSLAQSGMSIFFSGNALHYQWYRQQGATDIVEGYRMDVFLEGSNPNPEVLEEEITSDYEVFYTNGIGGAISKGFKKISFRNVYPGIDWVFYLSGSSLKYDFVVQPGADASIIKLRYSGATKLSLNSGNLEAGSPMGSIVEQAPYAFEQERGREVACSYGLRDSILSFALGGYSGTLVIDPIIAWATFYGGSSFEDLHAVRTDDSGNVYGTGVTSSAGNIATVGAHQSQFVGGNDVLLFKFNSAGVRQWGTYFGVHAVEQANALAIFNGDVYIGGLASSDTLASPGSHQSSFGGGLRDGLLAKFSSSGILDWATYYGGAGLDVVTGVAADSSGVCIAGSTRSSSGIASPGSFQPVYTDSADVFVARFDHSGNRIWGTYLGGAGNDSARAIYISGTGSIYVTGTTASSSGLSTPGSHQPSHGGSVTDAFLVKLDRTGQRLWSTYYGGAIAPLTPYSFEIGTSVTGDEQGYIFLAGQTGSLNNIATSGTAFPVFAGIIDGFVAKFDTMGQRIWGSYLGGSGFDHINASVYRHDAARLYVAGVTTSPNNISTADAIQPTINTQQLNQGDICIVAFDQQGQVVYGTYYGLPGVYEQPRSLSYDPLYKQFFLGGRVDLNPVSLVTPRRSSV